MAIEQSGGKEEPPSPTAHHPLSFFETLIETIPIPVYVKDTQGRYLNVNGSYEKFVRKTKEEILGRTVFDMAPKEIAGPCSDKDNELFRNPGTQSYPWKGCNHEENEMREVVFNKATFVDGEGKVAGMIGVISDVTVHKRTEMALREYSERLSNIINFLPDATFVIDNSGTVIAWNKAIEEMTGVKAENIVGKGDYYYSMVFYGSRRPILIDLIDVPAEELNQKYSAAIKSKNVVVGENYVPSSGDRKGFYAWGQAGPLFDSTGKRIGAIESIRDISAHRQLEEELRKANEGLRNTQTQLIQSEKMAALGHLVSGIAHEINNPIGIIIGFSQGALRDMSPGHPLESALKFIESEAVKCKQLVQNLLVFMRSGKQEKALIDLNVAIEEALSFITTQTKVRDIAMVKEMGELPNVLVNRNQIQQVILHLANNAIDAMSKGGTLTVRTKLVVEGRSYVEIQIQDTGKGIPEDIRSQVFNPFFTTKEVGHGPGLGLSLAYEIVRSSAGKIFFESEVGKGTLFHVLLPIAAS